MVISNNDMLFNFSFLRLKSQAHGFSTFLIIIAVRCPGWKENKLFYLEF